MRRIAAVFVQSVTAALSWQIVEPLPVRAALNRRARYFIKHLAAAFPTAPRRSTRSPANSRSLSFFFRSSLSPTKLLLALPVIPLMEDRRSGFIKLPDAAFIPGASG
jgi:hypothetical protein